MNFNRTRSNKGFSLVELLAVVLILAVLAAVAIPLYINTRKSSAARACKANIAAVATAESAFALRNGAYTTGVNSAYTAAAGTGTAATLASGLVGAPEGLQQAVNCPLDNTPYTIGGTAAGPMTITCVNEGAHQTAMGVPVTQLDWERTLPAPTAESTP